VTRLRRALGALEVRNYRLYFAGQVVSFTGNWMQQVAIAWLLLDLTGSAFALGVAIALQTLPYLVIGLWGGLVADRLPRRKLLLWTQFASVVPPVLLWLLVEGGAIRVWMVYVIAVARGVLNVFDNPARQSFIPEMVGRDRLVSAVSLNASIVQAGRLLGPAVAAAVIAGFGLGPCFALNALTFLFMAVMLLLMRPEELSAAPVAARARGQLREAFRCVARSPDLRMPLLTMGVVGLFSFNFLVVLPAIACFTYHGTATTYALMVNALAAGALVGSLVAAGRLAVTRRTVSVAALAFGAALGVAGVVDELGIALVALVAVGATSVMFSASVQSVLQLTASPEMRSRVLSLYQTVYQGTTPLGSLLMGTLAGTVGARSGLILGSLAALAAGGAGLAIPASGSRAPRTATPPPPRAG